MATITKLAVLILSLYTLSSTAGPNETLPPFSIPNEPSPKYCVGFNYQANTTNSTLESLYPRPTQGYGWKKEDGFKFGNVVVQNNCAYDLYLRSVGVWPLGGPKLRDTPGGLSSPCDDTVIPIKANSTYTEPYRITCPIPVNGTFPHGQYCADEDKLAGQGISMKFGRTTDAAAGGILQFEYALVQDPVRGDDFHRLNYDVSLLDCGTIQSGVVDANATKIQHTDKVDNCPGYDGGVAVTFLHDGGNATNCAPIYCNGEEPCKMIYTWDRTRQGEASLACEREYRGDMRVDLCAKNNPERAM
ncbi:hypothetical protein BU24DRAFT_485645 [Aaosphaeria arxii CBS 175.79]|uniref:Lytic polysaccharide monooxygenase n=1 Tax=Aaosphaeria arxii CBS 175.79 TaxID=1450172 RepID=A0A6A5XHB1_9PLEO|nr:uncharacterized protein BU24DRAFT_485645 [Aaosphaeria arxii CBS 175.79]KAF2012237.1 hypothetical protein BU24DRAFT_485645 [Aaosphaeria arxii CBS 175.79]